MSIKMLTVDEVAKSIGVTPRTIWRWADEDRFPKPVALGPKLRRWREADIEKFLAELA